MELAAVVVLADEVVLASAVVLSEAAETVAVVVLDAVSAGGLHTLHATACRIALIDCILQRNGIAAAFEITASLIVIFGPGGGDINGCIAGCCVAGDRCCHTEEHGKDQSQCCNFPINLFH